MYNVKKILGDLIKRMKEVNLQELSIASETHYQQLWRIRKGENDNPTYETLVKIDEALAELEKDTPVVKKITKDKSAEMLNEKQMKILDKMNDYIYLYRVNNKKDPDEIALCKNDYKTLEKPETYKGIKVVSA